MQVRKTCWKNILQINFIENSNFLLAKKFHIFLEMLIILQEFNIWLLAMVINIQNAHFGIGQPTETAPYCCTLTKSTGVLSTVQLKKPCHKLHLAHAFACLCQQIHFLPDYFWHSTPLSNSKQPLFFKHQHATKMLSTFPQIQNFSQKITLAWCWKEQYLVLQN